MTKTMPRLPYSRIRGTQRVEAIIADADGHNVEKWPTTWGVWRKANAEDKALLRDVEASLLRAGGWAGGGGAQPRFGLRIIGPWPHRYTGR